MSESIAFLGELFGRELPEGLKLSLWQKSTKTSSYFDAPERAKGFDGLPDVYVSACLVARSPGPKKRLKRADAAAIPGVWADLDVRGGPEDAAGKRPAPDVDAALECANALLTPTLLVNSGYGIQAWWLFEDLWVLDDDTRTRAAQVSHGWNVLMRQEAQKRGWTIDSTFDLARLMRLPGTLNDKGPSGTTAEVRLIEGDGPRYALEDVAEMALVVAPREVAATSQAKADMKSDVPAMKLEALKENNDSFRKTWEHTRKDRESSGWSASEYDLALASHAARAGWTDSEISALIRLHRQLKYPGDKKAERADYIERTIRKARSGIVQEEREEEQEAALEEMAEIGEQSGGAVDSGRIYGLFNQAIGGDDPRAPRVKELVQYGLEPDSARFVLVMSDGQEVNVGSYANLRQPRRLDEKIAPVTGFVIAKIKDNETWRGALNALMSARDVREEGEEPLLDWVRGYTEDRTGTRNESAPEGEPFEEEEYIYIKVSGFAKYVKIAERERLSNADMHPLLRRAGFEQKTVHHPGRKGKPSTASYWRIKKEVLE